MINKKQVSKDILYKTLIGRYVEIINSKNSLLIGKKGLLVYESANLLFLEQNGSIIKILKSHATIKLDYEGKPLNIDARFLNSTIQNRIKKIK